LPTLLYVITERSESNPAVKKYATPKNAVVKKDVKSKVAAKNGCDGRVKAKILITTIQVNLVLNRSETGKGNTNSPELSLLKFLPLAYHHSLFLAATLDFTSFFTTAFLRATHFLIVGLFFWIRLIYNTW